MLWRGTGQLWGLVALAINVIWLPRTTSSVRSPIIYPAYSLLLILGAFWLTPTFYSSYNSLKSDRNKCPGNKTQRWETYVSSPLLLPQWVTGAAAPFPKPPAFWPPPELVCELKVVYALLPSSWSGCQLAVLLEWRAQLVSSSLPGISPSMQLPTLVSMALIEEFCLFVLFFSWNPPYYSYNYYSQISHCEYSLNSSYL